MDAKKRLLIERHAPLAIRQKTDVSACHLSVDTSDTLRTLCPGTEFLRQARFGHSGQQSPPIKALNARGRAQFLFPSFVSKKRKRKELRGIERMDSSGQSRKVSGKIML